MKNKILYHFCRLFGYFCIKMLLENSWDAVYVIFAHEDAVNWMRDQRWKRFFDQNCGISSLDAYHPLIGRESRVSCAHRNRSHKPALTNCHNKVSYFCESFVHLVFSFAKVSRKLLHNDRLVETKRQILTGMLLLMDDCHWRFEWLMSSFLLRRRKPARQNYANWICVRGIDFNWQSIKSQLRIVQL